MLLDLIHEVDIKSYPNINRVRKNTIISQSGLRYAQAKKFIEALLFDEKFNELDLKIKNEVISRALSTIIGRMMEDTVLLETRLFNKNKDVFKFEFSIGEFDMVVFDKLTSTCEIYEIKHSKEQHKDQIKHLIDATKLNIVEKYFGKITKKAVIYRGSSHLNDEIHYINVEEYLISL